VRRLVADTYVFRCRRGWLQRTFLLGGAIETEIRFDALQLGIGAERTMQVRVDGESVGQRELKWELTGFGLESRYTMEFQVRSLKSRGKIEVSLSHLGLYQLTYFKLTLADRIFYEEGGGRVLQLRAPPPLPIAARAPEAQPVELPIPSEADEP
jgi:hypothetical protein